MKNCISLMVLLVGLLNFNFAQECLPIQVERSWNLLSLPFSFEDSSVISIYPTARSNAFIYKNGYMVKNSIQPGTGFWLKFDSSETITVIGDMIEDDTIAVEAGWNIIGSLSVPVPVDSISSDPAGIRSSDFYSYIPRTGYRRADTLYPGIGYWVKTALPGLLWIRNRKFGPPCPGIPRVTYWGWNYRTVQIGKQCWLRRNLNIGKMINGSLNQYNNDTIEKYCFKNNTLNCYSYGGLFQWDEAMKYTTTSGAQGLCPTGWHIPTNDDLNTLIGFVGNHGNALKALGVGVGPGAGTNTSGFTGLLTGYRVLIGNFYMLDTIMYIWSSEQVIGTSANLLTTNFNTDIVSINGNDKNIGASIRCLYDLDINDPPNPPENPSPYQNETNVTPFPTLSWTCTDPDNDPLTYDVYCGIDNPPANQVATGQSSPSLSRNGLNNSTTYYWKVVAHDDHGHSTSGPVWSFTTAPPASCDGIPTVTYEGKTYNTVQIGTQCWLKENLDVGTMIPGSSFPSNNGILEKFCYDNDPANCTVYGGLYSWAEAMRYITESRTQGICPTGWHIPTREELNLLEATVNNDGNSLKAIGQGIDAGTGTNTSGFTGLLAGYAWWDNNYFDALGAGGLFWSSTETDVYYCYVFHMDDLSNYLLTSPDFKEYEFSVRCIKD